LKAEKWELKNSRRDKRWRRKMSVRPGNFLAFLFCLCLLPFGKAASADEAENASIKAEIDVLKDRLAKLEERLSASEASPSASADDKAWIELPSGIAGIKMSGFMDTSFTLNANTPSGRVNTLRVFDTRAEDFMINNAELVLEKTASPESPVGFRTDLDFGSDSKVVGAVTTGLGSANDVFNLQQAYVEYLAPIGNGLDIKAGKFVTLHGAEVIESKDNWNFSRSFLFGYAIPFTHTGLRASYQWSDWLTTIAGISNGWDVVDDNNKAKTAEFSATITPSKELSFITTYMFGAEQPSDSRDLRHLFDVVATYQPLPKLTLKLNADLAYEEDALSQDGGGNASWDGLAAYAKYDFSDWYSLAGRFEVFNDQDGFRTGANVGALTGSPIDDLQLFEWTLTNEFKLNKHLLARLEYRLDKADSEVFGNDGDFSNYQNTVALEFIAPF
jgi:hypothetical protein